MQPIIDVCATFRVRADSHDGVRRVIAPHYRSSAMAIMSLHALVGDNRRDVSSRISAAHLRDLFRKLLAVGFGADLKAVSDGTSR